ncbi:VIT family protein [uncultured archaeon]|nr:VIT family protein [uncultured archaeon]
MNKHIHKEMKKHLETASPALQQRHLELEQQSSAGGSLLRQIVLGGQDGLVNVLGILLGMASGTGDTALVILAGLAATVAESVSMAAVAYTSARASQDHYKAQEEQELREMEEIPEVERKEVELIYFKKGFRGKALDAIVKQITSDKKLWLQTMMREELGLYESEFLDPTREAIVVGIASVVGSLIPLVPFFFMPVAPAMIASVALSIVVLFIGGSLKAKITTGVWWKSGMEMAIIGGSAAILGYFVGLALGAKGV